MVSNVDNQAPEKWNFVFFSVFFPDFCLHYVNPAFASSVGSGQTEERVESILQP